MPQVGRLAAGPRQGLWYALGFGGHGVAPTTASGEVLADAISGRAPVPAGFAPFGLRRVWGPLGLAAAQATYTREQWRDAWRAYRAQSRDKRH
jgi:gamma-glutamylputrescine oxidase